MNIPFSASIMYCTCKWTMP